ncbi:uncharacterized protein AMSG_01144 [Thecamonas trahens ATCC 50062]|uniref:Uncharacterized protein n=1 Tax=Thecamonas trahens ATCC 50062 TaxID=461836 RepID=A0A0L0DJ25_THETB|nr:hypothetical protein AMSG_01144 [Thecamonas trahens ATCC 50062]KNC52312.1 hypothetical protein AMSG_01144 [Thecamonas trahens ATCC 50062]|eukprot:XP_013762309.1 hypothetical protein AMSG_01144 [Thecamonas trahens ATCC 50062]
MEFSEAELAPQPVSASARDAAQNAALSALFDDGMDMPMDNLDELSMLDNHVESPAALLVPTAAASAPSVADGGQASIDDGRHDGETASETEHMPSSSGDGCRGAGDEPAPVAANDASRPLPFSETELAFMTAGQRLRFAQLPAERQKEIVGKRRAWEARKARQDGVLDLEAAKGPKTGHGGQIVGIVLLVAALGTAAVGALAVVEVIAWSAWSFDPVVGGINLWLLIGLGVGFLGCAGAGLWLLVRRRKRKPSTTERDRPQTAGRPLAAPTPASAMALGAGTSGPCYDMSSESTADTAPAEPGDDGGLANPVFDPLADSSSSGRGGANPLFEDGEANPLFDPSAGLASAVDNPLFDLAAEPEYPLSAVAVADAGTMSSSDLVNADGSVMNPLYDDATPAVVFDPDADTTSSSDLNNDARTVMNPLYDDATPAVVFDPDADTTSSSDLNNDARTVMNPLYDDATPAVVLDPDADTTSSSDLNNDARTVMNPLYDDATPAVVFDPDADTTSASDLNNDARTVMNPLYDDATPAVVFDPDADTTSASDLNHDARTVMNPLYDDATPAVVFDPDADTTSASDLNHDARTVMNPLYDDMDNDSDGHEAGSAMNPLYDDVDDDGHVDDSHVDHLHADTALTTAVDLDADVTSSSDLGDADGFVANPVYDDPDTASTSDNADTRNTSTPTSRQPFTPPRRAPIPLSPYPELGTPSRHSRRVARPAAAASASPRPSAGGADAIRAYRPRIWQIHNKL